MNEHLARWIRTSINDHFHSNIDFKMFVTGAERDTSEHADWFEVRVDGPWTYQTSKNCFEHTVEINVLIAVGLRNNIYLIDRRVGEVRVAFTPSIAVSKMGIDPVIDDEEQVGCLNVVQTKNRNVSVYHYGQIEPEIKIIQAVVEARYMMELNYG